MNYRILLYYHYNFVEDPETEVAEHLAYCQSLGLRGRVYIAPEGINLLSNISKDTMISYEGSIKKFLLMQRVFFRKASLGKVVDYIDKLL